MPRTHGAPRVHRQHRDLRLHCLETVRSTALRNRHPLPKSRDRLIRSQREETPRIADELIFPDRDPLQSVVVGRHSNSLEWTLGMRESSHGPRYNELAVASMPRKFEATRPDGKGAAAAAPLEFRNGRACQLSVPRYSSAPRLLSSEIDPTGRTCSRRRSHSPAEPQPCYCPLPGWPAIA